MHPAAARRATAILAAVLVSFAPLAACAGRSGAEPAADRPAWAELLASAVPSPIWRPGRIGAPPPSRVLLSRLGIDAALQPLQLGTQGELVPPEYGEAGWYKDGPEPGEPGRAVIAGHVDSLTGPDVFAELGQAHAGDRIEVHLTDGAPVTYLVHTVEVHPRDDFPTLRVYGSDGTPELRLITCTGLFDADRGGYQENVVVFAGLAGVDVRSFGPGRFGSAER